MGGKAGIFGGVSLALKSVCWIAMASPGNVFMDLWLHIAVISMAEYDNYRYNTSWIETNYLSYDSWWSAPNK